MSERNVGVSADVPRGTSMRLASPTRPMRTSYNQAPLLQGLRTLRNTDELLEDFVRCSHNAVVDLKRALIFNHVDKLR